MNKSIYRKEAIEYKKYYWKGKALLLAGMPAWLVALLSLLFLVALILALFFCRYTQHIDVRGEVITLPHSVNVFAPQQGFVVQQHAKPGDVVKKGDFLYELDVSRHTTSGNVADSMAKVITEKMTNAEEIIVNLTDNKQQTLNALNEQVRQFNSALKETLVMLKNTETGLKQMRNNLKSYDNYLRQGLITKDQYNYQHSLYFQQQSAYQSLTSQRMQQESQLTQLKSDIVTKAADFDNQISSQKNNINDFKSQMVESTASGNAIIRATTSGKIESMAVTAGQMVDKGSSLAQIKPMGDINYYLVIWLPNNSIPYLKTGDTVNIRYDAFPSDKFGQFPRKIISISSVPASRQEMSEYTNVNAVNAMNQQELALYKTIVEIKDNSFNYNGKKLSLSSRLKAQVIVFLEERPLYMWMFTPFYKISQSVSGPIQ